MTKIRFKDYHRPNLTDGKYRITAEVTTSESATPYQTSTRIQVGGPIQPLQPSDIANVFPPEGSMGDHAHVLPHVVLHRATLPWERLSDPNGKAPWLALLTLRGDDPVMPLTFATDNFGLNTPPLTVIDLPSTFLSNIAPLRAELPLLAHVRETTETAEHTKANLSVRPADRGDGSATDSASERERAVILSNRLPGAGQTNTCLLVAVERRYAKEQIDTDEKTTRLIVLKHWSFTCEPEGETFLALMNKVKSRSGPLRLPPAQMPTAEELIRNGAVAMPATFRDGSRSGGLYRGPFIAAEPTPRPKEGLHPADALSADALLRFDPDLGIFDTSYAAAWALGRLIGLSSRAFARALSMHRRALARATHTDLREEGQPHLRLLRAAASVAHPTAPPELAAMRRQLARVEPVPFAYLVPDEGALPPESLRFFHVDPVWIEALTAGAFSLGRTHEADLDREAGLRFDGQHPAAVRCGVLLRSEVVSGWPDLIVEGITDNGDTVAPARLEQLGPNMLLALFSTLVQRVDVHLHPEGLHHGFAANTDGTLVRILRDQDGSFANAHVDVVEDGPLWRDAGNGILSVTDLADAFAKRLPVWDDTIGPADGGAFFGFQMLEGVDRASLGIFRA